MRSKSAFGICANGPPPEIPALFTSASRRPYASTTVATMRSGSSTTLWWSATASPPAAVTSATTASAGASAGVSPPAPSPRSPRVVPPKSFTTTRQPCAASIRAYSRPSPRPPPVTSATRPSKRSRASGASGLAGTPAE